MPSKAPKPYEPSFEERNLATAQAAAIQTQSPLQTQLLQEQVAAQKEQAAALTEQRDIVRQQAKVQGLLAPVLYKQAGLTPQFDEQGNITGFTENPQAADPNATLRQQIETGVLERQNAALKGELPVDPALQSQYAQQEATLRESLLKQFGAGYETGTGGGEALRNFQTQRDTVFDAARRGDITALGQLSLQQQAGRNDVQNANLSRILSTYGMGAQAAGGYTPNIQGYGNPYQNFGTNTNNPFLSMNQLAQQSQQQGRAFQNQQQQERIGYATTAAGIGLGIAAAASSVRFKKDITALDKDEYGQALKRLRETPIVRYRYKHEGPEREPHIGVLRELAPREIKNPDGATVSLQDWIGLAHAGLKAIDRKVDKLRDYMETGRPRLAHARG
jgi:Chaperone of endosialidase